MKTVSNTAAPIETPLTPKQAQAAIPCSHSKLYKLIGEGRIKAYKLGRATLIPPSEIRRLHAEMQEVKLGPAGNGAAR